MLSVRSDSDGSQSVRPVLRTTLPSIAGSLKLDQLSNLNRAVARLQIQ